MRDGEAHYSTRTRTPYVPQTCTLSNFFTLFLVLVEENSDRDYSYYRDSFW